MLITQRKKEEKKVRTQMGKVGSETTLNTRQEHKEIKRE
jgi:hypothetical protein